VVNGARDLSDADGTCTLHSALSTLHHSALCTGAALAAIPDGPSVRRSELWTDRDAFRAVPLAGELIARFLIQRVRDDFSVGPAAAALTTMSTRHPGFAALAVEATETILTDVLVQSLGQEARQRVYGLMLELTGRFESTLSAHFGDRIAEGVARQVRHHCPPCLPCAVCRVVWTSMSVSLSTSVCVCVCVCLYFYT
jgi:hypothetical protein